MKIANSVNDARKDRAQHYRVSQKLCGVGKCKFKV